MTRNDRAAVDLRFEYDYFPLVSVAKVGGRSREAKLVIETNLPKLSRVYCPYPICIH